MSTTSRPAAAQSAGSGATSLDVEAVLLVWWQDLLGIEQVGLDDDFFELGGHSLIGVQLFARIKKAYGLDLVLSTLFDARTVRLLAQVIAENGKAGLPAVEKLSVVVPIQSQGSKRPLFWIPGGNGTSVLAFREISFLLGPDQPVYGIESKMPEPDQEFASIPERATRFIGEIKTVQPKGPYSLIGFCGGGHLVYEMAQQLSAAGEKVGLLAIVECPDPRYPLEWAGKARFRVERIVWRIKKFLERGPKGIAEWAMERSGGFVDSVQLRTRRVMARTLGKAVPAMPAEPVDPYEKAMRTVYRYNMLDYPGKSVVFIAKDTYYFCGLSASVDPRLLWCNLSKGGSEARFLPGDHMDLLESPVMYQFAEELKRFLEPTKSAS